MRDDSKDLFSTLGEQLRIAPFLSLRIVAGCSVDRGRRCLPEKERERAVGYAKGFELREDQSQSPDGLVGVDQWDRTAPMHAAHITFLNERPRQTPTQLAHAFDAAARFLD